MDIEAIFYRKINALFPDASLRTKALQLLSEYGIEKQEQEPTRVKLAVLRLSGSKLERIEMNTRHAKDDFRDILVMAETPNIGKAWRSSNRKKRQHLLDVDRENYDNWLGQ